MLVTGKVSVVLAVLLGIAIPLVTSDDEADECKKMAKQYFKKIPKIYKDCHADVKQNASSLEESYEKIGCTMKCILKEDKMLDDNEMVTDDIIKATYKNRVTPKFEEKLLAKFMECKDKFGSKLDKSDDKCVSYKAYGLCMQESISHICYE